MKYSGTNTLTEIIVKTKEYVNQKVSGLYNPAGSIAFSAIPTLSANVLGNVYNITDATFTTDARFVEGAGKTYTAGTNIVVVNTGTTSSPVYMLDVLSGLIDFDVYVVATADANGYPDIATPDTNVIYLVPTIGGCNSFYYNGTNFVGINLNVDNIQKETLPAATANLVDKIYQYTGATSANYTQGYFYKCTEDTSTVPSTYKWEQIDVQSGGSGGGTLGKNITATVQVGGVNVGDTFTTGTSYDDVIESLISPALMPTLTDPTVSISGTGNKLLEMGSTLSATITVTFNRGSISPAYGTDGYRAGAATSYSLNGGTAQADNTFTETVTSTNNTFTGVVNYGAGEQPLNSKGGNYDSPYPAGSKTTSALKYEFVYALYANTSSDITVMTKQSLVSKSAKVKAFTFPATTAANPEAFDVPSAWTVSTVEVLNTLSGQWETATSQFTVTTTTHTDAGGNTVNYNRYTCNLGYALGSRQVRVKWN